MGGKERWVGAAREMAEPVLLQAKLEIPALPPHPFNRSGLVRCLDDAVQGRCTAVIAPAGFGKTVGVVQWLRQGGSAAAWLTLDPADNSLPRFWSYLGAALGLISARNSSCQESSQGEGSSAPGVDCTPDPVSQYHQLQPFTQAGSAAALEKALPLLIQQLSAAAAETLLVLDDYHLINEPEIHKILYYFVRYLPPNIRVILISRTPPPFILSRSKLGADYGEIGAADLCFDEHEFAAYNRYMGLQLSPARQVMLLARSGGWPMALFVAAAYLEKGGLDAFEESFRGDNGEMAPYLEAEIFAAWPQEVQEFLLHTAVLETLTAPLCDALRESSESSASMLADLASASPFVSALPGKKGWYSCTPLLREYLQGRLRRERESLLPELHRRAATWYWHAGMVSEALHHFCQGSCHDQSVRLLEQQAPELLRSVGTIGVLLEWLNKLPRQQVECSAMLCIAGAWANALSGHLSEAQQWLEKGEALCGPEAVPQNSNGLPPHQLQQEIALIRVYLLICHKKIGAALELLEQACHALHCDSIFREKGLALHRAEPSVLPGPLGLYGRLQQISRISQSMQEEMSRIGFPSRYFNLVRAELLYEWNNLAGAVPALMEGLDAAERDRSLDAQIPLFFLLARLCRAQGEIDEALQVVAEAERRVQGAGEPQWQPLLSALRIRLHLQRGELEPARQWLQADAPRTYDSATAGGEYAQLTLARVLLAEGKYLEAMLVLERRLVFARQEDRLPSIIEILNLQALASQEMGQTGKALAFLERSLHLACPEGYVRIYIDEGSLMWALLQKYNRELGRQKQPRDKSDRSMAYVRSLLRHMKKDSTAARRNLVLSRQELASNGNGALLEPLTKRELQVLRLLAQDLSNAAIAASLSISLNTVKVFNRNIFAKLEVKNRTSAVERARTLGIVE